MGYYHNQWSYTSPSGTTDITLTSVRSGSQIIVDATVTCTLLYSGDYIAYDGEINFNMWSGSVTSSANIKGYSDRWYYSDKARRTKICSMALTTTASSVEVAFNLTVPAGNSTFAVPTTTVTLEDTDYSAPSAPTWINITPNPCGVTSAPVITWGGASAGSLGTLLYDIEVRQTKTNGEWTNWVRWSSAQSAASYTCPTIENTTIDGTSTFAGVQYQYRVRSSDGSYETSDWITSSNLTVTFTSPTAPTSVTWNVSKAEPGDSVTLRWSGASGGSTGITWYRVRMRVYTQSTGTWSDWRTMSYPTSTSYTVALTDSYNIFANLDSGDLIQGSVRVTNDYDQVSSEAYSSGYVTISGNNVVWIKVNDTWKEGQCYIKISDTWREGTPYIKVNDTWREAT